MNRIAVNSSNVVSIGYEGTTLEVEFNSGTYQYLGIPRTVYDDLMAAHSKGKFINSIRNDYSFLKVA